MSKYTTEVRFLCESLAGLKESEGYNSIDEIINNSRTKIFNFDYPIFDVKYKSVLETKILKHYYTREIGEETVGLWKLRLDARMNEIMPYYNKLYETELLNFNPLEDTNITTTSNRKIDSTRNDTGNTASKEASSSKMVNSGETGRSYNESNGNVHEETNRFWDTPQNGLSPLNDSTYLTDARKIDSTDTRTISGSEDGTHSDTTDNTGTVDVTGNSTMNSIGNSVDDYVNTVVGKSGRITYPQMIMELRETFINLDMMVIKDLSDLFMNIW